MSNKKPEFLTFTGIDSRTDLYRADELARKYPIEWGVLFSRTNDDPRYPPLGIISDFHQIAGEKSAHLCGAYSREAQRGEVDPAINLGKFGRCQINGHTVNTEHFSKIRKSYGVQIICQWRGDKFPDGFPGWLPLYDCSGGRGIEPSKVPTIPANKLVGYAGGIGPDTVLDYLSMIDGAGDHFWLDMEGQIRTDGWFDLDKVERVCQLVYPEQPGTCQKCGCVDDDCSGCVERTGQPCHWVNPERTLCSACAPAGS